MSLWKKVAAVAAVASVVVVGTAGGVYAAWFQQTPSASGSQSTARLTSTFLNTGTNTWTTAIPVLNPGDYLYRYLAIANPGAVTPAGTVPQSFTLTVAGSNNWANPSGDTALQITVSTCSVAWVTGASPTCQGGSGTAVVTKRSVVAIAPATAFTVGTLNLGQTAYLMVRLEFPTTATSASWGHAGTITLTVPGAQLAAADRSAG